MWFKHHVCELWKGYIYYGIIGAQRESREIQEVRTIDSIYNLMLSLHQKTFQSITNIYSFLNFQNKIIKFLLTFGQAQLV